MAKIFHQDWFCRLPGDTETFSPAPLRPPRLGVDGVIAPPQHGYHVLKEIPTNWGAGNERRSIAAVTPGPFSRLVGSRFADVFGRSALGIDIWAVRRGFADVLAVGELLSAGAFWTHDSSSPANPWAFEFHAQFLDGGVAALDGDYFWGLKGVWAYGVQATRLLCFELGVSPKRWPATNGPPPSRDTLWSSLVAERLDDAAIGKLRERGLGGGFSFPSLKGNCQR